MCDENADLEWTPIGAVNWQGGVCTLEFCGKCGAYRARMLDINEVEVVEGTPDVSTPPGGAQGDGDGVENDTGAMGQPDSGTPSAGADERDEDDDDGDDWLVK